MMGKLFPNYYACVLCLFFSSLFTLISFVPTVLSVHSTATTGSFTARHQQLAETRTCREETPSPTPLVVVRFFLSFLRHLLLILLDLTDVIDYYHLADDAEGNPVFSLDVRPAVDDLATVQERVGEWWKLKKETIFGAGESSNLPPGVRVQEN
jgi:hypothetical protein